MSQLSFSEAEYVGKRKKTRREKFLAKMERAVPWKVFADLVDPHYPKPGIGRPPYPLETMLRSWCGALVVVSHDEAFLAALALEERLEATPEGWRRRPF